MRHRSSVSSLLMYRTWPGPPPDVMIRQKLALVLNAAPSVSLRRMNGFSPVRMTRLGSAIGMVSPPRGELAAEHASPQPGQFGWKLLAVCCIDGAHPTVLDPAAPSPSPGRHRCAGCPGTPR